MRNYLSKLSSANVAIIRQIGTLADQKHIHAYLIGGVVRDLILGKHDVDLDVVIEGDVRGFSVLLAKELNAQLKFYQEFGTATLTLPNGKRVDLAKTRKEIYARPGALPSVKAGTLKEDLLRRDFTINTLAIQINEPHFGKLINEFRAFTDLKGKRIRVLHENSFIDDPTRILRAIRFEQRFSFKLEPKTFVLLKAALRKNASQTVSPPRYFNEFIKTLREKDPIKCLKRLQGLKGLAFLGITKISSLDPLKTVQINLKKYRLSTTGRAWFFYFLALIEDQSEKVKSDICQQLHLTREEKNNIMASSAAGKLLKDLSRKSLSASEVFELLHGFDNEFITYLKLRGANKFIGRQIDHYLSQSRQVKLVLNGHDFKKLGVVKGEEIGRIQRRLLMAKIDGKVPTIDEERKFVLKNI